MASKWQVYCFTDYGSTKLVIHWESDYRYPEEVLQEVADWLNDPELPDAITFDNRLLRRSAIVTAEIHPEHGMYREIR